MLWYTRLLIEIAIREPIRNDLVCQSWKYEGAPPSPQNLKQDPHMEFLIKI